MADETLNQPIDPVRLTRREVEILALVIEGYSSKQVADLLFISKRTVDFHLDNVYGKLNVKNKMQALQRATRLGPPAPRGVNAPLRFLRRNWKKRTLPVNRRPTQTLACFFCLFFPCLVKFGRNRRRSRRTGRQTANKNFAAIQQLPNTLHFLEKKHFLPSPLAGQGLEVEAKPFRRISLNDS